MEEKNYKPVLVIDDMPKKRNTQPDWIALILAFFGVIAIYNSNPLGFYFLILALIKYFWTISNE